MLRDTSVLGTKEIVVREDPRQQRQQEDGEAAAGLRRGAVRTGEEEQY